MSLAPRLEIRQAQSLTLTPQLMQSIKLLQLSHLELNTFVEAELLQNPLLERDSTSETGDEPETSSSSDGDDTWSEDGEFNEDSVYREERLDSASDIAGVMDTDVENVFPEQTGSDADSGPAAGGAVSGGEGFGADLEQYVKTGASLADHLAEQATFLFSTPAERLIARHLIDNLDEAGYLGTDCETVAEQLGTDHGTVETILVTLQGCEPVGVFARDLADCLSIQLREKDRLDPLMQKLIDNLHLVANHDMGALMRAVGADREDLADMLAELRSLDPRPGRAFDGEPVQTVVPDVFVRAGSNGWQIELNSDVLPRVLVNRTYYSQVVRKTRDTSEKSFLSDCLQTANWLTKSLDQRAQTILKVATEIVRQQDAFFVHGIAHLRPMTLKTVAEAIDMHESTVSRVTSNKYLATPRGLFEMKYFFTTALGSTSGGEDHSSESVRHRIRQLIEAELPSAILSDDTIADMLKKEQGIDVARRTVAKYREGMNIPSSVIRRRQKRAMAEAL